MISKLCNNHFSAFAMPKLVQNNTSFILLAHLVLKMLQIGIFQDGGSPPSWI
jgi:hypothetical protein